MLNGLQRPGLAGPHGYLPSMKALSLKFPWCFSVFLLNRLADLDAICAIHAVHNDTLCPAIQSLCMLLQLPPCAPMHLHLMQPGA